jgi:hypothetical protein
MQSQLEKIRNLALEAIERAADSPELERLRVGYLGKKESSPRF